MEIQRTRLREMLVSATSGCWMQHDGWPCNTCFHTLRLPLTKKINDYWLAVLAYRGDYPELEQKPELIEELYRVLIDMNY